MIRMGILAALTFTATTAFGEMPPFPAPQSITLRAVDGVTVFGSLTKLYRRSSPNQKREPKIALLFHQAGSNLHEYDTVTPLFHTASFDTLAIDQRSGGTKWGKTNQTVSKLKKNASYLEAKPDLEAALSWAKANGYKNVLVVGSSYSAALVFMLAAEHPEVFAIASFSPGDLGKGNLIANAAAESKASVYVTAASNNREQKKVDQAVSRVTKSRLTRHRAKTGVHGISTLRPDKNPKGYQKNRQHFSQFLISLETPK